MKRTKEYSETSSAAFYSAKSTGRLGELQFAVADYVQSHSPTTRAAIAAHLTNGKENLISAAVLSLIQSDQIRRGPKVLNASTGQRVESLLYNPYPSPKPATPPVPKETIADPLLVKFGRALELLLESRPLGFSLQVTPGRLVVTLPERA